MTAWEILLQRDYQTGFRIDIDDETLSNMQISTRSSNQLSSAKYKAKGGKPANPATINTGSLVYVKHEGDKTKARDRYLVVKIADDECILKKLTKSNIRNKELKLKLTEVYPVVPNLLYNDNYRKGFHSSDDEDAEDITHDNQLDMDVCYDDDNERHIENNQNDINPPDIVSHVDNEMLFDSPYNYVHPSNDNDNVRLDISCGDITEQCDATPDDSNAVDIIDNENSEISDSLLDTEYISRRPHRSKKRPLWVKDYEM